MLNFWHQVYFPLIVTPAYQINNQKKKKKQNIHKESLFKFAVLHM